MQCRSQCGACCIAPSILTPFYGMPLGKPAGVRCVHLAQDYRCSIFYDARRPSACADFAAESAVCGDTREQALANITVMEVSSTPASDGFGV